MPFAENTTHRNGVKGLFNRLAAAPLHPLLFAAYFVFALVAANISQLYLRDTIRSLIILLCTALVLSLLMGAVLKSITRGAIAASLLLFLFFSYGHVYHFVEASIPIVGHHRILLPIWLAAGAIGTWLVYRRVTNPLPLTSAMNLMALVALILPIYEILSWEISQAAMQRASAYTIQGVGTLKPDPTHPAPDVYLIILDMYARHDLLETVYGYDNSAFLGELEGMGFTVVECSQSNYSQTELALASVLNMNYLDQLGKFDESLQGRSALRHLIQDNAVMRSFKTLGYHLVAFETGYPFSEFRYADDYLRPAGGTPALVGRRNAFEEMLVESTLSLAISDLSRKLQPSAVSGATQLLETKRNQVLFELDKLPQIAGDIQGPKFVFAHILALHEPYVFSAVGSPAAYPEQMDDQQSIAAFKDQLTFIDRRMGVILRQILARSETEPIIILQGDTGPGLVSHQGRMENLSALYLPGDGGPISSTFSPVNDFRLVFDRYFAGSLGFVEDRSYFSLYTSPYDFERIPNDCQAAK